MRAGEIAIAAIAEALLAGPADNIGCVMVDEVASLSDVLRRIEVFEPGTCVVEENFDVNSHP